MAVGLLDFRGWTGRLPPPTEAGVENRAGHQEFHARQPPSSSPRPSSFLFRGFFSLCAPRDQEQRRITGCNKHTDIIIRPRIRPVSLRPARTFRPVATSLACGAVLLLPASPLARAPRNLIIETYRRHCSLLSVRRILHNVAGRGG